MADFRTIVKQGASYLLTCAYAINGVDQLPLLASIASQVRTQDGVKLCDCDVAQAGPSFTLSVAPSVTATWPEGVHLQDIKYAYTSGAVVYTPTWQVYAQPRETTP